MTSNLSPPVRPPPFSQKRQPYPHIQDLIARTNHLRPSQHASIKSWIGEAKVHWHQAKYHRTEGILDGAYVNYLLAFTIIADVIPRCQDYPSFRVSNSIPHTEYLSLAETIKSCTPDYTQVREAIEKDNQTSGVVSTVHLTASPDQSPTQTNGGAKHPLRNGDKAAPEIRAKPGHLASKSVLQTLSQTSAAIDDLQLRFNKLQPSSRSGGRPSSVPPNGLPPSLIAGFGRPQGPREMPSPKAPQIDVKNAMPQMPPPVYSPSAPPRSSRSMSIVPDIPRPNLPPITAITLTVEALYSYMKAGGISLLLLDVRPRDEFNQGHIFSRSTVCIEPIALRDGMSADDLEDSLEVSPHTHDPDIFKARNQCDLVVYYDQSTSDTSYVNYTPSSPAGKALGILYTALVQYNFSKPLKQPPLLLVGGLDAWIDIAGIQSSKVGTAVPAQSAAPAQTAAPAFNFHRWSQQVTRAPTPLLLERRAVASQTPPPYVPYPGSREASAHMPLEPINIEEEEKWMEQLRRERDHVPLSNGDDSGPRKGPGVMPNNTGGNPYARTVEDFFKQYPATPHAQESMIPRDPESPTLKRNNTIIDHPFHGFTDVRNPDFNPPLSPARPPPVAARKSYSGVSERLATPVHSSTPARPPKLPLLPGAVNFNIGTTGLKNLGNTCYMNSILQCMSGTIPVSRYFLDGSYKQHINKDNPLGSRGVLAEAFASVIKHLWSGEYSFISPVTFKDVAGRLNETFSSNGQQDAQEFLEFLLDGLHEDLNPNANRNKLKSLTEEEERRREKLAVQVASCIEWRRYIHLNSSVTVNWLQGQLSSRLTCLTCRVTSTTYNPFMYLSLPIPVVQTSQFTLRDCLREFTKEEVLSGDDAWNCPRCKQRRKATKRLTITRLPHILIIHLKRFTNQGRWRDKLNTPISFPLADLDLTEYVPPPLPPEQMPRDIEPTPETTPPFHYDLYGIANHYGTLHGGHYTAFVKNPYKDTWNCFDDSKATRMDESQVMSRNAYVLFWVRKNIM